MTERATEAKEKRTLRDWRRSAWLLVSLAFRADPVRAVAVIVPVVAVMAGIEMFVGRQVVDAVVEGDRGSALSWVIFGAIIGSVGLAIELGHFTIDMRLREHLSHEVDQRLINLCSRIPTVAHFERTEYADRVELLRTNRHALMGGVSALAHATSTLAQFLITVGLLVFVHPGTLIAVALGIPAVVISARSQSRVEKVHEETAEDDRRALHIFDTATTDAAAKEVRVFGLSDELTRRYEVLWRGVARRRERAWVIATLKRQVGYVLFVAGFIAALAIVARAAMRGQATAGDLFLSVAVIGRLTQQLQGLAGNAIWLATSLRNAARYLWILDYADKVEAETTPSAETRAEVPERFTDGIRLEQVCFQYGDDEPALDAVDLHLPAGSTIAVVGDNGAGKTTLVKILCGLYRPTAGRILVDGIDLADIPVAEWRARISAAFQDHANFELVAHEVVGVGDLDRLGDVPAADGALARAAGTDVMRSLDEGWHTALGTTLDGADLSGGQWQKLALARAMMRESPLLLVLDEPTSALDAETEHALFERYAVAARDAAQRSGAITLLVSHRFSTVRMADLIVVLERGCVTELGSHAELMARGGTYAELYSLQASAYG